VQILAQPVQSKSPTTLKPGHRKILEGYKGSNAYKRSVKAGKYLPWDPKSIEFEKLLPAEFESCQEILKIAKRFELKFLNCMSLAGLLRIWIPYFSKIELIINIDFARFSATLETATERISWNSFSTFKKILPVSWS